VPSVQRLKFKWLGHNSAILHTTDIKREASDFVFLKHVPTKKAFMADLVTLIEEAPSILIAAVIDNQKLVEQVAVPDNSYNIALQFCVEAACEYLEGIGQHQTQTTNFVEERSNKEDAFLVFSVPVPLGRLGSTSYKV